MQEEFRLNNGKFHIAGTKYIPDVNPKNIPIILCHGFLSNQKDLARYKDGFLELGYTVYTFDFCGSSKKGKSEGSYDYMTVEHELKDLQTVIDSVTESKNQLMLFGVSQGAFMALLYAARNPAVVARVLTVSPALCIPDDARRGKMLMMTFDPNDIRGTYKCKKGMNFSPIFAEEAILLDTDKIIKEVLCPVCIVHGAKDEIVNASYLRKTLENLSHESFVYFLKKANHSFKKKEQDMAIEYFKDFLKEKR